MKCMGRVIVGTEFSAFYAVVAERIVIDDGSVNVMSLSGKQPLQGIPLPFVYRYLRLTIDFEALDGSSTKKTQDHLHSEVLALGIYIFQNDARQLVETSSGQYLRAQLCASFFGSHLPYLSRPLMTRELLTEKMEKGA